MEDPFRPAGGPHRLARVAAAGGLTALLIGAGALLRGAVGTDAGASWLPHPLTGVMLACAGVELIAFARQAERLRVIAAWATGLAVLVGAAALLAVGTPEPLGFFAPLPSVFALSFIASASLLYARAPRLAHLAAAGAGAIVITGLSGYLLALDASATVLAGMAPATLAGLAALTAGLFTRWPQLAPTAWWARSTVGGRLARRMVVAVAAIPLSLGWLLRAWDRVTELPAEAGQALFVAATVITLGAVLAALVARLDQAERVAWRQRTAAREALAASEELHRAAFEHAPIGVAVVGLDGRFQRVNAALSELTGFTANELLAQPPFAIVHPDDADEARAAFTALDDDQGGEEALGMQTRLRRADGSAVWVEVRVTLLHDASGAPEHALAQIVDITDRRKREAKLRHLADHDALTGQLNRRGFEEALQRELRTPDGGAVLLLDLDGFKAVNDTLGHAAGDALIIAVGHALRGRLRDSDVVARLGGDEFAVIIPGVHGDAIDRVADDLVRVVREQAATVEGVRPGAVTASIGVADLDPAVDPAVLVERADAAMYRAKLAGKNGFARHAGGDGAQPGAEPERRAA